MKKLSQEYVEQKSLEKNIKVLDKYKNIKTKIHVLCLTCNYDWYVSPNTLLNSQYGCPSCSKLVSLSIDKLYKILNEKYPNIILTGEYKNHKSVLNATCTLDGNIWSTTPSALLSQKYGCRKCFERSKQKTNEKFIEEVSNTNKYIQLIDDYSGNSKKIKYICKKCGYIGEKTARDLIRANACKVCSNSSMYKYKFHTDEIKEKIKLNSPNMEVNFLEENFNSKTKFQCVCTKCGIEQELYMKQLLDGYVCAYCENDWHKKYTTETFKETIYKINNNIEIIGEYTGRKNYILVKCKTCGEKYTCIAGELFSKKYGCKNCYNKNNRGENHCNWNQCLSEEDRLIKRGYSEYTNWRESIYERDNYTCRVTNIIGNELVAHHILGYNIYKKYRLEKLNGITLSKKIHNEFHSIYGRGENNDIQFEEFIKLKYSQNEIDKSNYDSIMNQIENLRILKENFENDKKFSYY